MLATLARAVDVGRKSDRAAAVTLAGIGLAHRNRKRQFKFRPGRWICCSLKGSKYSGVKPWHEPAGTGPSEGRELVDARRDEHRPSGHGSFWRLSSRPPSRRSVTRSCPRVCNDLPETSGCAISCVEPTPAAVAHLQLAQLDQLPRRCSEVPQVGEGPQKPPWSATRGERNTAGATASSKRTSSTDCWFVAASGQAARRIW